MAWGAALLLSLALGLASAHIPQSQPRRGFQLSKPSQDAPARRGVEIPTGGSRFGEVVHATARLLQDDYGEAEDSTATYYGADNPQDPAAGTMGGACGYGNLYQTGYGQLTAAASTALYNGGTICGACYKVTCKSAWQNTCNWGQDVVITVTNQCPQGSEGGWCDFPKHHLDMSLPAWSAIATNVQAGVVHTSMVRVPCSRNGGVGFQMNGNPFWLNVLVYNVAGAGDLQGVKVSTDHGANWVAMGRNWGSFWSAGGQYGGNSVSFQLTDSHSNTLTLIDAVPEGWYFGGYYTAGQNFGGGGGGGGGSNIVLASKPSYVKLRRHVKNGRHRPKRWHKKPIGDNHIPMSQRWWRTRTAHA